MNEIMETNFKEPLIVEAWTLYQEKDPSKRYVAKCCLEDWAELLIANDSLEILRWELQKRGLIPFSRTAAEDPNVIEIWLAIPA